jgi:voltage-gated potassium channel
MNRYHQENLAPWQARLHEIIFEADTPAGKAFDIALLVCIVGSIAVVFLSSVQSIQARYGGILLVAEWFFTLLFSVEYILRLSCVGRPLLYARSFFGIVDLLAVLPTYVSLLIPGTESLMVVRAVRFLRIFRVLKLARHLSEGRFLARAVWETRYKITVFMVTVLTLVLVIGACMYVIEGEENGFDSIPRSMYWAIVTLTTVGYGDISPQTTLGQFFASLVMIIGYGILAVPTGIVTVALSRAGERVVSTQACPQCSAEGHDADAKFCKYCGARL